MHNMVPYDCNWLHIDPPALGSDHLQCSFVIIFLKLCFALEKYLSLPRVCGEKWSHLVSFTADNHQLSSLFVQILAGELYC